ncbi:MAG: alpha/beta fold hydrolase [Parvularculaceae bacterium]|nr:alpha/beta fold hydrolase [Parvularculaceae bacterium]
MLAALHQATRAECARPLRPCASAVDVDIPFPDDCFSDVKDPFVRLRFAGTPGAPRVLVLGGISAGRKVSDAEDGPGWWRDLVCPGGGVDLDRYEVVGADFFPLEPEAPLALAPADYAEVFADAIVAAGFARLHAVVGGSFGGMIGLALARRRPEFVGRLAVLCAAHKPSAIGAALRGIQRDILALAAGAGEAERGVALARSLAMTTYRTHAEFEARFANGAALSDYLAARGADYAKSMYWARYVTLSGAIDRHDEEPEAITTPTLIVAATSDQLVPVDDARALARRLAGPARFVELASHYGHDAFLKESAAIAPHLADFLKETL